MAREPKKARGVEGLLDETGDEPLLPKEMLANKGTHRKLRLAVPRVAPARLVKKHRAKPKKGTTVKLSELVGSHLGDLQVDESTGVLEMKAEAKRIVPEGEWCTASNPMIWSNSDPDEVRAFMGKLRNVFFIGR